MKKIPIKYHSIKSESFVVNVRIWIESCFGAFGIPKR